jgi:hypothetical protein
MVVKRNNKVILLMANPASAQGIIRYAWTHPLEEGKWPV